MTALFFKHQFVWQPSKTDKHKRKNKSEMQAKKCSITPWRRISPPSPVSAPVCARPLCRPARPRPSRPAALRELWTIRLWLGSGRMNQRFPNKLFAYWGCAQNKLPRYFDARIRNVPFPRRIRSDRKFYIDFTQTPFVVFRPMLQWSGDLAGSFLCRSLQFLNSPEIILYNTF